jgi:hypothetical protein
MLVNNCNYRKNEYEGECEDHYEGDECCSFFHICLSNIVKKADGNQYADDYSIFSGTSLSFFFLCLWMK